MCSFCLLHHYSLRLFVVFFFFFNDTATTEIYTLSLHDALPIFRGTIVRVDWINPHPYVLLESTEKGATRWAFSAAPIAMLDRKSTRLNSSHGYISYAVFCLKKKKTIQNKDSPMIRVKYSMNNTN